MRNLIIYDTTGRIIFQGNTTVQEPVGIPFLWVDIPERKQVIGINISVMPNIPIYEDIPKTETQLLQEQVNGLTIALAEMMGV